MNKKIVIIGGVAGGATAAARLRRLDEQSHIVLMERGEHISFANCGLPYYIGETIQDRNKLLVQTVEGMKQRFNLDIRNLTEAIEIDRQHKRVKAKNLVTGELFEETYDQLILSPGAKPIVPPIPGINEANAFTLRNIPDTDRIKSYVDLNEPKHATIIGGGFIGIEMAENLVERGLKVSLIEKSDQVMGPIDPEMAAYVHDELTAKGVELILEDGVKAFEDKTIILESDKRIQTDMTILSIGVKPESTLAKEAGLETGSRGGIIVNDYLRTNDESIYAIGDAIEVQDYILKQPTMVPLAWPANRQGRIVADNIYGENSTYPGTLGTSIVQVFDYTVAATGVNEKRLKASAIPYQAVHIHPGSHAGYYPGAEQMAIKLLFNPGNGDIFGAQIVSKKGADKRIDVLATAIKGGLKVYDLPNLELAYAPPYSSAKDPINMAGYVATNVLDGDVEIIHWDEVDQAIAEGELLLDVRNPKEVEKGTIQGSLHIPLDELRDRIDEIPEGRRVNVMCQAGLRGYLATKILWMNGFTVRNLDGGWKTYSVAKKLDAKSFVG